MAGQTFTTYINATRTGSVDAEFSSLGNKAGATLSGIQKKAEAATKAIAGLSGGRGSGGRSPISSQMLQDMEAARVKAERLREANERLTRSQTGLVRGLRTTGQTLQIVQGPLGPIAGRVNAAADAMERLTGVTLGLAGAGAALFAYTSAANKFVELRSKLSPLFETQEQVNQSLERVAGIANRARTGLEPVVDLYAKMKLAADQFGMSQERALRITELASKAATLSGGSQQSREAGLYQFAQGFGSGSLGGDELKSVRENTLFLARSLSEGLGKLPEFKGVDTSIGKLKELGAEGKLTADVIARAMEAAAGSIEEKFAKLPPTLAASFTTLSNNATMFVGRFEEATGVVDTLASGLLLVGNNLNVVIGILGGVAAGWAAVAAAQKAGDASAAVRGMIDSARARQTAAKVALETAVNARTATVQQTVALASEKQAILANIAALEKQLVVERQLKAEAANVAKFSPATGNRLGAEAAQREAAATRNLIQNVERLSVVQTEQATTGRRVEQQTKAIDVAKQGAAKSSSLLRMGVTSLIGAINPLGIAVGILTTVVLAWATGMSDAEKNAKKLEDSQRKLATVIDLTTGKIIEQNAALLAGAKIEAAKGADAAVSNYNDARRQIGRLSSLLAPTNGGRGAMAGELRSPQQVAAQKALLQFANSPNTPVQNLLKTMDALAAQDPKLKDVRDRVAELGSTLVNSARDVTQARAAQRLLAGDTSAETLRRANRDFSGGRAIGEAGSNRDLAAEAEVMRKQLADRRFAAGTTRDEALARLEERRGKMSQDDYVRERAQVLASYDREIASIGKAEQTASDRADREEARRKAAEERRLKAIERENEARERRTEKRTDLLQQWSEEPKAVTKARDQIDDLNRMVGETMNGLQEISDSNPLGQGIYTQAMADGDAARIREGLQRPYNEYMEARQRDLNISELTLAGRDAEAEALRRSYDLYDSIGQVTEDQYQSILQTVQREQEINDLLADRERLLAPIKQQVDNIRGSLTDLIENTLNGANPLKSGKAFIQSIMGSFTRGIAEQATAKLTAGMDARVRDLISGSVQVDAKIADYLAALDDSGGASRNLSDGLNNAASAANAAAAALGAVASSGGGVGANPLAAGGSVVASFASTALAAAIPSSFYKPGTSVGSGMGDDIIYRALGGAAKITDNLRSQQRQNTYYQQGLTPARVSDHTRTDEAWDVRLPSGVSFASATASVRAMAKEMGRELIKAVDETQRGGTGRHAHYVFGAGGNGTSGPAGAAAPNYAGIAQDAIGGMIGGSPVSLITQSINAVTDVARSLEGPKSTGAQVDENGDIVVTGRRRAAQDRQNGRGPSMEQVYNKIGGDFGAKIDKALGTKFFAGIGSKLGTALQGASTGMMASGVAKALGIKQSSTGSAIGGAVGNFIPGLPPGVGAAIGGLIGGTIGGLFKKTKSASVTVSGSGGAINVGDVKGSGANEKAGAASGGNAVGSAVQRIADALGAEVGNFSVSIGMRKGTYRVDSEGQGRVRNVGPTYATEEEAIMVALRDAINDGAIAGISAASQTLLRMGSDLERQLAKAQVIESIPKRLMALKDPVRYAVTELNREFASMISYLKEGGATAQQFAEAQELYDLERARAIEQATQRASTAIQDMLDGMLGGQNSPLNRRTVYENAQSALNRFTGDVQSGKAVDTDAFLKAVQDFQEASRGLNGSSQSFFTDFDFLIGLLNKAKANQTGTGAGGVPTDLPASPFSDAQVQALITGSQATVGAINVQTGAIYQQTDILSAALAQLLAAQQGQIGPIQTLPSSVGGGSYARYSDMGMVNSL